MSDAATGPYLKIMSSGLEYAIYETLLCTSMYLKSTGTIPDLVCVCQRRVDKAQIRAAIYT